MLTMPFILPRYRFVRSSSPLILLRIASSRLPFWDSLMAMRVSSSSCFITTIGPSASSAATSLAHRSRCDPAISGKANTPQQGRNGQVLLVTRVHAPASQKEHNFGRFLNAILLLFWATSITLAKRSSCLDATTFAMSRIILLLLSWPLLTSCACCS